MRYIPSRSLLVFSLAVSGLAGGPASAKAAATSPDSQTSSTPAVVTSVSTSGSVPAARETKPQLTASSYVLGSGDQISIKVQEVDEITERPLRIDPDGGIDLPLVGHVQASGLTLAQLRSVLVEKFRKYVNDPQVSANLVDNQSRPVSVIGEVGTQECINCLAPRA